MLRAGLASQPQADPARQPTVQSPQPTGAGFVPPTPEELAPRFPDVEIIELLGKGGMGAVYKARQRGLERLVALKILPPEVGADPAFAERFAREARALARLSHQNIVGVHHSGHSEGLYYFVMEFVDGVNLRQAIEGRTLAPKEALAIVPQICDALQYAHDEGIVHRDIKPENILIDKRGRVKIADFGLAKLLGHERPEHSLTGTHQVMGTLRYMAPEQMEGSREVDHRADIYSLGVVFYEMLTGELPIGRFAPPSQKVEVDVRLDEVVLRSLEKEPERRFQHASEVKTEVERISQAPAFVPPPIPVAAAGAGTVPETDREKVRLQIRAPAIALLITGILYSLFSLVAPLSIFGFFWIAQVRPQRGPIHIESEAIPSERSAMMSSVAPQQGAAKPITPPSAGPVDLLALVNRGDLERDAPNWRIEDGKLICEPAPAASRVQIPFHSPPDEYDLDAIIERTEGSRGINFGMMRREKVFYLGLDIAESLGTARWSGLGNIDGKGVADEENPTRTEGPKLMNGKKHSLRCQVRATGITVTLDGEPLCSFQGDYNRIFGSKVQPTEAFFIFAHGTTRFVVHRLSVTPYPAAGE
jgi:predicted Ser/Thr protein kinase